MPDPEAQQKDKNKPGYEPLFTTRQLKHTASITGFSAGASRDATSRLFLQPSNNFRNDSQKSFPRKIQLAESFRS